MILLCNDPAYWSSTDSDYVNQIDRDFWLIQGRSITGRLAWASHAGLGSIRGREQAIELKNSYLIDWWDYVEISGQTNGLFKALTIPVKPAPMQTPSTEQAQPLHQSPKLVAAVKKTSGESLSQSQDLSPQVNSSNAIPKEKKVPNWKRLNAIVVELGGRASLSQIRMIFDQRYQDQVKSKTVNVGPDLAAISVNHNSWHHFNQSGATRLSDPSHPKDRLFYHEATKEYEVYCPNKHGVYQLTPGIGTKFVQNV